MHRSRGTPVNNSCIMIFARNIHRASTGSVCRIQRLLPSKDIEGAVIKFMDAKEQRTTHTNRQALPSRIFNYSNSSLPFHKMPMAQSGIKNVPRPPLWIMEPMTRPTSIPGEMPIPVSFHIAPSSAVPKHIPRHMPSVS